MNWWTRNWRWLLVCVGTGLASIAVLVLYILYQKRQAESLRRNLELLRAGAKVEGLEAEKKARSVELAKDLSTRAAIDMEIADAKRNAVEVVQSTHAMSDEQVALAFRKLGF